MVLTSTFPRYAGTFEEEKVGQLRGTIQKLSKN